jgi:hypothetical protein
MSFYIFQLDTRFFINWGQKLVNVEYVHVDMRREKDLQVAHLALKDKFRHVILLIK